MKTRSPRELAQAYLNRFGKTESGLTLRYWQGGFLKWNGQRYFEKSKEQLASEMTQVVEEEFEKYKNQTGGKAADVTRSVVSNAIQALAGMTLVDEQIKQPAWLGAGQQKRFIGVA